MSSLRIYGANFLEALAIYICQILPARLWLTLGPREIIIKQIVESIQPALPIQMIQSLQIRQISFESDSAYILFGQTEQLKALQNAILKKPARLLVLLCDEPSGLSSQFKNTGIQANILSDCSDLAMHISEIPLLRPAIYLINPSTTKSTGDLVVNWVPEIGSADGQKAPGEELG